jgi:hypothetical protein
MRFVNVQVVYCHSAEAYTEGTLITEMMKNKWDLVASQSEYKNV